MKTYHARTFGNVFVLEDGKRRVLPPRLDLVNHSPDGFGWGYGGSGPAQLALAIIADVYDDETALFYYQRFKAEHIAAQIRDAPFHMTLDQVLAAVEGLRASQPQEQPR